MRDRPRLVEDSRGRLKLAVTFSARRNRLALSEPAIDLLRHELELDPGDIVPTPYVPILVARRDAELPDGRDVERTVAALPAHGPMSDRERDALVDYLESTPVEPQAISLVEAVVAESPVSDSVRPTELPVASSPNAEELDAGPGNTEAGDRTTGDSKTPDSTTADSTTPDSTTADSTTTDTTTTDTTTSIDSGASSLDSAKSDARDRQTGDESAGGDADAADDGRDPREIPGVGDTRASDLESEGFTTVERIAAASPADLAAISGISDRSARVAVEGARQLVGDEPSTAERLAAETGRGTDLFEPILSQLAAAGVPPSEARPVLRRIYAPSIADIDSVQGNQAFFLWEAGYRSPMEIATADVEDLTDVRYVGDASATAIRDDARDLVSG